MFIFADDILARPYRAVKLPRLRQLNRQLAAQARPIER